MTSLGISFNDLCRFLPENKTGEHQYTWLPFGLGNRSCIAMRLALLEAKVAICKAIRELRFEKTDATVPPVSMNDVWVLTTCTS